VFGKVIDGIEVVNSIEEKQTTTRNGHQDVPEETIEIEKAVIL
jgi:peptidyl-prolyl cis-trans isomerase B (cyclophilin B)